MQLRLENYRGFQEHNIPLRPLTLVVGRNNAGKSTLVEALRLVAVVSARYRSLPYSAPPKWLGLPRKTRGISPSLKNLEINLLTVNYHYGEPPAKVVATFSTGAVVEIYVGREAAYAVIQDEKRRLITSKGEAARLNLPSVDILPQVAPLAQEERVLNPEYVRSAASSSLASLHFRNQLHNQYGLFRDFKAAVEETWRGLRIRSLDGRVKWPAEGTLSLLVQDGDFTAEASWMGHGLQMWLQTIWFLVRAKGATSVILDEPDVYMHADLQRKLIRYLKPRFPQVIVATHSTEIIAEVEPDNILIVDRAKTSSVFAPALPAVQRVIESVGSVHNLHLTRLWTARRFLMTEGDDLGYLKRFQDALHPNSSLPIDTIPSMEIKGWGGWNYAVGSSMFIENAGGEGIVVYCILDSDFHSPDEIANRYRDAATRGVQLHVWRRKEIENYLLHAAAIQRVVEAGLAPNAPVPTVDDIRLMLDAVATQLHDETFDNLASELGKRNRGWDAGTANKRAREMLMQSWSSQEGRLAIISGKKAISLLSEMCKQTYGVSFGPLRVAREMQPSDLPAEVRMVIEAIETGGEFPPPQGVELENTSESSRSA